jgi:hypothetical protein
VVVGGGVGYHIQNLDPENISMLLKVRFFEPLLFLELNISVASCFRPIPVRIDDGANPCLNLRSVDTCFCYQALPIRRLVLFYVYVDYTTELLDNNVPDSLRTYFL